MKKNRNSTIDLLRVISMLMIIVLHEINKGIQPNALDNVYDYINTYILALVFCSVNLFVLISANFLCDNNQIKLKTVGKLLVENWVINFLVVVIIGLINGNYLSKIDIVYVLFPFFTRRNWFVCVYLILYLVHPFLNIIISRLDKTNFNILILLCFGIFSVLPSIMPNRNWTFDTMYGYSIIWFIVLYFSAAYIRKFGSTNAKERKLTMSIAYLGLGALMVAVKKTVILTSSSLGIEAIYRYRNIWFAYDSVPVYLMSVIIYKSFYQKKLIKHESRVSSIISGLGASTLGVYLIHDNYKIRDILWTDLIRIKSISESPGAIFFYLLIALLVFILCSAIYILLDRIVDSLLNHFKVFDKTYVIE